MNCLSPSAQFEPLVSRNSGYEKLAYALRLFCGRGRRFTVPEVAQGSGVPERAIQCALYLPHQHEFRPLRHEYLLSLSKFLGAAFVSAWLEPAGMGAFELMDGEPPLPHVLVSAPQAEDVVEERKRLIRRLAELEDIT